jgi:hypothetical protein
VSISGEKVTLLNIRRESVIAKREILNQARKRPVLLRSPCAKLPGAE